jgi:hypothetical protein
MKKLIFMIMCVLVVCSTKVLASPYFLVDSNEEWREAINMKTGHIKAMTLSEWEEYMYGWQHNLKEGEPYPTGTTFLPPQLYVYGGGGGGGYDPEDAGLVMCWGDQTTLPGSYSSAWKWKYGLDPDLRNCTIQITITPPQFNPGLQQINAVSFAITDIAGLQRQWWWSVGNPPAPIPWTPPNPPTTITINTAIQGVAATTPVATGYASAPGFNLAQSQSFDADENFLWIFGPIVVPPPGQLQAGKIWNYWSNLLVTPNAGQGGNAVNSKWYLKWSQPPDVLDPNDPPKINGWDERSDYNNLLPPPIPIMADDWRCKDDRPVTDFHWWGSFLGWTQPTPPPIVPTAFHIGIWTDVPDDPCNPNDFSHPGVLVWENFCDNWVWNFAGYDEDPWHRPGRENEACFQFAQFLSQDEWFHQDPCDPMHPDPSGRIYWLSISAIYPPGTQVQFPFGWKTRPHFFQDDATSITALADGTWPPKLGAMWVQGAPLKGPNGETWDLAFELTTNAPTPGSHSSADLNFDGIVNFKDFAYFADHWLSAGL